MNSVFFPGRRRFLASLAALAASLCLKPVAAQAETAQTAGNIPVLMFHKVTDRPHSPEEISPQQLEQLFTFIWLQGFAPLNMSDILHGQVDDILPAGRKALGITVDDAHPSVLYARGRHSQALGNRSFLDIFTDCAAQAGLAPRASLYLSGGSYFGGNRSLAAVLDMLAPTPGIELGYHTRRHQRMRGFGYTQTRKAVEEQIENFSRWGVLDRIPRILAYPYGLAPEPDGMRALVDLGFMGGLLAFPGLNESGAAARPPVCRYDRQGLLSDPLRIPRINVGAFIFAPRGGYAAVDPISDFRKDVGAFDEVYHACGEKTQTGARARCPST